MKHIIISIALILACPVSLFSQKKYTLTECEQMALENNHKITKARLEIKSAEQAKKKAFTNYFPQINATGGWFKADEGLLRTELEIPSELSTVMPGIAPVHISLLEKGRVGMVTATQPLFTGGRIIMGNQLAKIGKEIADIQLDLSHDEVLLTTREYYYLFVKLNDNLTTLNVIDSLLSSILEDVKVSVQAGLVNRNDLLRVELQKQEVESNRLALNNNLQVVKLLLAQYMGVQDADFEIRVPDMADYGTPKSYFMDPLLAVQQRKETKLLDHNVNASCLMTKMAGAERLPSVAIGASYVHHNLVGKNNNTGFVYATVSVPISDWWGKSHARKKQAYKALQTQNDRQNSIELMIVEVNQVWNELSESYNQIELAERSIKASKENLRLNRNFYQAGTVSLSDLLDAQVLFQQTSNQLSEANSNYIIKLTKYKTITGQ